jgi:uncharacterized protein (DUF1697 family)
VALLHSVVLPEGARLRMAALIALAHALGLDRAATVGSTGNLLFEAQTGSPAELEDRLETAFAGRFGKRIAFIVRSADALLDLAARNPFGGQYDPSRVAVRVMREPYAAAMAERLLPYTDGAQVAVVAGDLWIGFPEGATGSRLLSRVANRKNAATGTFRTLAMIKRICARLED